MNRCTRLKTHMGKSSDNSSALVKITAFGKSATSILRKNNIQCKIRFLFPMVKT